MSAAPSPGQPRPDSPTAPLPIIGAATQPLDVVGHRRTGPDRSRWYMWVAVVGAAVTTAVAAVTVWDTGHKTASAPPAAAATEAPASAPTTPEADSTSTGAPSPSARASSPQRSPRTVPRPAELLAGLQATVRGLVNNGKLSPDAGDELSQRLEETANQLAQDKPRKTRQKLIEFAEKLIDLREDGEISEQDYQAIGEALAPLLGQLS
ncbi:FIMAH domain-containing protein [Couchioplanes caeruleus]|uniref:FIMAH domain-containing protein n=1 Tax=Couchioplanes caeruleus TaxID=56438 RepID=UPI000A42ECB5|nr:hypothetical protein [Couchioplanes caeruleus]